MKHSQKVLVKSDLFRTLIPNVLLAVVGSVGLSYAALMPAANVQTYKNDAFSIRPDVLAACSQSGATGAGSPTYMVDVGAPVTNKGDSSTEINSAITTANEHSGGGEVVLESGTYYIDHPIVMASNVELSGTGYAGTTLKTNATNISVITTNGASNVTISGMTVDASGNTLADSNDTEDYTINIPNSTNVIVQQVSSKNPFSYAIVPDDATKFCVRNNLLQVDTSGKYTNLDGIHVENSTEGDVDYNYIDNRYDNNTDGDDGLVAQANQGNESYISYVGNVVRGGNGGDCMQFAVGPGSISYDTVSGNEFWGCPYGVRTGGYADSGSITNITLTDNIVHNLVPGTGSNGAFPDGGNAVNIGGFLKSGQSSSANSVTGTYICSAGEVVPETGTTISGTVTYTGCTDAASTTNPPPAYPPGS